MQCSSFRLDAVICVWLVCVASLQFGHYAMHDVAWALLVFGAVLLVTFGISLFVKRDPRRPGDSKEGHKASDS